MPKRILSHRRRCLRSMPSRFASACCRLSSIGYEQPVAGTAGADAGEVCVPCREDEEYMPFSGATACLPCTLEACGCRKGSYYDSSGGCMPCPAEGCPPPCPPLSAAFGGSCICPSLYYFSAELHLCVPCRECDAAADTIVSCSPGDTFDTTVCVCPTPTASNYLGFIC